MHNGAMDNALEACRGLRLRIMVEDEVVQLFVEKIRQLRSEALNIDIASAHDRGSVAVIEQRQKQVLERRIFVMALIGIFDCAMKRLFQAVRE